MIDCVGVSMDDSNVCSPMDLQSTYVLSKRLMMNTLKIELLITLRFEIRICQGGHHSFS